MESLKEHLLPNQYYHVYNHVIGKENLFANNSNYVFFLEKYTEYLFPVVNTLSYCLMPNHFHFVIQVKSEDQIFESLRRKYAKALTGFETLSGLEKSQKLSNLISKQFSNFFNSYAQSFNKQQQRQGTLFERPFQRKNIVNDKYLMNVIHYVHYNPIHHDFVKEIYEWEHSSYHSFLSTKATKLKRNEVINMFGDIDNFKQYHSREVEETICQDLAFL